MTLIDAGNALQQCIVSALKLAMPDITITDYVEEDLPLPYIQIGEDELTDNSSKTDLVYDAISVINIFSNYEGMKQLKELTELAANAVVKIDEKKLGYKVKALNVERITFSAADLDEVEQATIQVAFILEK